MRSHSLLLDFYKMWPTPVSIKDTETGKYIFANGRCVDVLGLTSADQMLGLTVTQLKLAEWSSLPNWAHEVTQMDRLACQRKAPVSGTQIFFNAAGRLVYGNVSKFIVDPRDDDESPSLVTLFDELDQELSAATLYLLYRKFCGQNQGITSFLRHLKLDDHFDTPPSEAELWVLIAQSMGQTNDVIAEIHDVPLAQVERHAETICGRIHSGVGDNIMSALQSRPTYDMFISPLSESERMVDLRHSAR
jgi:hypothetical protein